MRLPDASSVCFCYFESLKKVGALLASDLVAVCVGLKAKMYMLALVDTQ